MTTIAILQTGSVPSTLVGRHGTYDAMMRRMLGDAFACRTYEVQAGELPDRPEEHAAYLVTGSSAGVYDPLPWIAPLEGFVRAAQGRARMVGICFGHQLMAQALGGRVEKSRKGWGLGLHAYGLRAAAPWMDASAGETIAVAASHQDQVVAPPRGAAVLAASAFTPYAMLDYGRGAISVQFHPEFDRAYAEALVELRRHAFADPSEADRTVASLAAPSDAARVAGWLRRFLAG